MNEQTQFKIDTSGAVSLPNPLPEYRAFTEWSDLSPFQQGAVEAALREFGHHYADDNGDLFVSFRDLSASALQRIMADCERALEFNADEALYGRVLWEQRQLDVLPDFPPLTISLAEDGLIHLSEVG